MFPLSYRDTIREVWKNEQSQWENLPLFQNLAPDGRTEYYPKIRDLLSEDSLLYIYIGILRSLNIFLNLQKE